MLLPKTVTFHGQMWMTTNEGGSEKEKGRFFEGLVKIFVTVINDQLRTCPSCCVVIQQVRERASPLPFWERERERERCVLHTRAH